MGEKDAQRVSINATASSMQYDTFSGLYLHVCRYFQIWKASRSHVKGLEERGSELEKWRTKLLWAKWRYSLKHILCIMFLSWL